MAFNHNSGDILFEHNMLGCASVGSSSISSHESPRFMQPAFREVHSTILKLDSGDSEIGFKSIQKKFTKITISYYTLFSSLNYDILLSHINETIAKSAYATND
jgi:hypothetical protein